MFKVKRIYHKPIYVPEVGAECTYMDISGNCTNITIFSNDQINGTGPTNAEVFFKNGDRIYVYDILAVHFCVDEPVKISDTKLTKHDHITNEFKR